MAEGLVIHATALAIAVDCDGPLAGALLIGPSGSGKSLLALEAIESCPWRRTALVADDAPRLVLKDGACWAAAPAAIAGFIEVRGFGPVRVRSTERMRIEAAFDLVENAPRLPEPRVLRLIPEAATPVWPFAPGPASAARLRLAMRAVLSGQRPSRIDQRDA